MRKPIKRNRGAAPEEKKFRDDARGWAKRFEKEFQVIREDERFKDWQELCDKVEKRFRDERDSKSSKLKKLNLYTSSTQTKRALTFGKTPGVSVERKYADANDDVARVAGEEIKRLLNCENERDSDTFVEAVGYALQDYDSAGIGICRVRYEFETEPVEATEAIVDPMTGAIQSPAVPAHEKKASEEAPVDWVRWDEFLWGKAKAWHRVPWLAFEAEMTKAEVEAKFGPEVAGAIPYGNGGKSRRKKDAVDRGSKEPWDRACVWEIWLKETKSVFFYVEGYPACLTPIGLEPDRVMPNGSVLDPLGLDGFWPAPKPMLANTTTGTLVPVPEFYLAQDLYLEVDELTTRIGLLVKAIGVKGAYDSTASALKQLVEYEGNRLFPVDDWAMQAEKGGVVGRIEWFPLDQITNAILALKAHRQETIDLIYQVTGQSDIMRGQQTANGTPGEAAMKARFGSVRIQAQQDEFARFCTDIQRLRAQVIAKHFDVETIVERSNIMMTSDAPLAQQAAELIKSKLSNYRIEVKSDSVSMQDFASARQESTELLGGITAFMQALGTVSQSLPGSTPGFLQLFQASLARVKGASAFESITDGMIKASEEAQQQQQGQPPPPSPEQTKMETEKVKGQMAIDKEKVRQQGDLQKISAELQADNERERVQGEENTKEAFAKAQITAGVRAQAEASKPPPRGRFP